MTESPVVVHRFTPDEDNPGCDCGFADAVVRLAGGELLCAREAQARGVSTSWPRDVTSEYPYVNADGDLIWACCVSKIGPVCRHRQKADDSSA